MSAHTRKRPFYLRPLPILGTVAVLLFVPWFVFGKSGVWESRDLHKQKAAQAEQIRLLEAKKVRQQEYLTALKAEDKLALERAARERGFVAPNETIYVIRVDSVQH
ncbi:hypothetical protein EHM69_09430 [candidate division KSB1 bacterium]|nr:MAG: hypothetical protein EHM69_09430 [candidate division KSB1 bacterium]